LEFHIASIEELLRVAAEARVFPLLTLERRPSPHIEPLLSQLAKNGWKTEISSVSYEFQRGGNRMLQIERIDYPARTVASTE
jgi:hypothetical protein